MTKREGRMEGLVVDTNVLVGAGFKKGSASHRIVESIAGGELLLIWNERTRRESLHVVGKIPPLDAEYFAELFRPEGYFDGEVDEAGFGIIADVSDRKFAVLASRAGVPLVSNDSDFLEVREELAIEVFRPAEFLDQRSRP